MSKRRLLELVQKKYVSGWDDPRMPTICGLRRRGYTPESIGCLLKRMGVARREIRRDMALLEYCVREHLNKTAPRVMAVLDPVKVVIDNYPEGETEYMEIENNPEDVNAGVRNGGFCQGTFHRTRRFYGGCAEEIFPPYSGTGSTPERCLYY